MTTPRDIINMALKKCGAFGVGQIAQAEDVNDAFAELNMMLKQWQRKRWLVYRLEDIALVSTGQQSYTIGPSVTGQTVPDFVVNYRPDRLEDAYVRLIQPVPTDSSLGILQAREDYDKITLKSLVAFPTSIFYDPGHPVGTIYTVPICPAAIYEIHVIVKAPLGPFATLTEDVNMPGEYEAALMYNLAKRLRLSYQLPPDVVLEGLCTDSTDVIRETSAQIGRLVMPAELMGVTSGAFNVYSGRVS